VLELAMRGFGQIADLCAFARPDVGVITNVGPAHLELVGSIEGVARAKSELLDALLPGAPAIVPSDFVVRRSDLIVQRFGPGAPAHVVGFEADTTACVGFEIDGRLIDLEFSFTARHQALNALAALLAYHALGFPLELAQDGALSVELSSWRGDELPLPGGG